MASLAGPPQTMPDSDYYQVASFDNNIYEQPPTAHTGPVRTLQLKWWFWELFAASLSLAFFGAVIVVLKVFDGHALPQLPAGITLNTMVSLIGALSKTALLLVASATMSQLKWLWVHKSSRKLRDLQAFDEASRGPWGSLILMQHSRVSLASLGALITLLLLGFDPFIQQLIATPQRDISFDAASTAVHKASTFDLSGPLSAYSNVNNTLLRLSTGNPSITLKMEISNGASSQGTINNFTPSCPTSNCTWPTFQSLGLCSTCMDVTDYARKNWECKDNSTGIIIDGVTGHNRTCSYSLPNSAFSYEYQIFHSDTHGNYTEVGGELRLNIWATNVQRTTFSDNILTLISRVALHDTGDLVPGVGREQVQVATECALAMCVQEHSLSVISGIMQHSIKSVEQPFSMKDISTSPYVIDYDIKAATINNTRYFVEGSWTVPLVLQEIMATLPGNVTADYYTNQTTNSAPKNDGDITSTTDLASSFYAGLIFTQAVDNMATSVSQYMRSLSDDTTTGHAHNMETYIHVRWYWIALPAVLVASGIALLFIAMIQTSQSGLEVWKSSSLPLWFHGPPNGRFNSFANGLQRVNTLVEMEAEAGHIQVTLEKVDDETGGWTLYPTQNNFKAGYI